MSPRDIATLLDQEREKATAAALAGVKAQRSRSTLLKVIAVMVLLAMFWGLGYANGSFTALPVNRMETVSVQGATHGTHRH